MLDFFAKNIYLPLTGKLKGMDVPACLASLNESQFDPYEKLKERQWESVLAIVRHAAEHIPYCRERWKEAGIDASSIKTLEAFRKIPVLTKDEVREHKKDLCLPSYKGKIFHGKTSGSTGIQLEVLFDTKYMQWTQAAQWRGRGWYGVKRGDRTAAFWGRSFLSQKDRFLNTAKNRLQNIFVIQPFALSDEDLEKTWKRLSRFKPKFIYGYSASIARVAEFLEEEGQLIHVG